MDDKESQVRVAVQRQEGRKWRREGGGSEVGQSWG